MALTKRKFRTPISELYDWREDAMVLDVTELRVEQHIQMIPNIYDYLPLDWLSSERSLGLFTRLAISYETPPSLPKSEKKRCFGWKFISVYASAAK